MAGGGATSVLRRSRAFCACGLSMTGQVEAAWMIATMASMESASVSRCFRWSTGMSHDVADHGSMEGGASSGGLVVSGRGWIDGDGSEVDDVRKGAST